MARRKFTKQSLATAFIIAAVFVGTFLVVILAPPEHVRAVSENGNVRVEGVARGKGELVIREPLQGFVYEVLFGGEALPPSFTISMNYQALSNFSDSAEFECPGESAPNVNVWNVALYDTKLSAWRAIPSTYDPATAMVTAEVPAWSRATLWTASHESDFCKPEYNDAVLLDELLSFGPERAVGYEVVATAGFEEGSFGLVDAQRDRGGCDGRYRAGSEETVTTRERKLENGSTYRLIAFWQLEEGCEEGEHLSTSN